MGGKIRLTIDAMIFELIIASEKNAKNTIVPIIGSIVSTAVFMDSVKIPSELCGRILLFFLLTGGVLSIFIM
ncbi:MAG: hypothetical protein E7384_07260 [Ruminococcaceae bacterium]|nr:hypothetical protein [Oscillospiraceae bacterium]